MKYKIVTYGCQANRSDSERIASLLESIGYVPSNTPNLVIVNACSIRQSAVERVRMQLKNLKTEGVKTILTGCVLKQDYDGLSKEVDLILNIKDLPAWPNVLGVKESNKIDYFQISPKYEKSPAVSIPIMTGCNNFCTYCVVPYTRGREQSRPIEDILSEAQRAVSNNHKELWLLGQNVNSYNSDSVNFVSLLKSIEKIFGDFWIRFLSSHPKDFTPELIAIMKGSEKITEYLNLPVQSGDDEILERMNRPYTVAEYKESVFKIIKEIPTLSISTDVIVGFPGETEKAFNNTIKLFKEIKFDMAYISKYSPRPGTPAFKLKDDVSHIEKSKRFHKLTNLLKKTALRKNQSMEGGTERVLAFREEKGLLIGRTRNHKLIKFPGSKELIGTFVKVKIKKALPWGLKGIIE